MANKLPKEEIVTLEEAIISQSYEMAAAQAQKAADYILNKESKDDEATDSAR